MKTVYFIGICGSAMSQTAVMLKDLGHEIYGSDLDIYPPASDFLKSNGISILKGFKAENLDLNPDLIVIGNALSRDNPEVEEVLNRRLRFVSLPEVIREFFIRDKHSIVVSGTHGKSTVTGMLAHIFSEAGYDPGFILGGISRDFNTGARIGGGKHFIIEGDEYDTAFFDKRSKFLHYLPECLIINSIEFDHADIFASLDEIKTSFKRLINILPSNGFLIINGHDENLSELSKNSLHLY